MVWGNSRTETAKVLIVFDFRNIDDIPHDIFKRTLDHQQRQPNNRNRSPYGTAERGHYYI
jgi:hypothetical protein